MTSPASVPSNGSTRSAILRVLLLAGVLLLVFAAARWTPLGQYLERDALAEKLLAYRHEPWSGPLLVALFTLFGVIGLPVSPLIFAGAVVFGVLGGWFYSSLGCILGASLSFAVGTWLGGDLILRLVGQRRFDMMMKLWQQHGFWTVFRLRFLPIPFPIVNYGAALAGIRFATFVPASALGLVLSVAVWNYVFHTVFAAASGDRGEILFKGLLALGAMLVLTFVPRLLRGRSNAADGEQA